MLYGCFFEFSFLRGLGWNTKNEILWSSFKLIARDASGDIRDTWRDRENRSPSVEFFFIFLMKMMVRLHLLCTLQVVEESWMVYWEGKGEWLVDWRQVWGRWHLGLSMDSIFISFIDGVLRSDISYVEIGLKDWKM